MMKNILIILLCLFTHTAFAKAKAEIHCTLYPVLFVGNLYLDLSLQSKSFEITYDAPIGSEPNTQLIAVQGSIWDGGKDSMGFEKLSLCTSENCSGPTYLGELKAVDQKNGHFEDRISYLNVNPDSAVKITFKRLGHAEELDALYQFMCSFQ